MSRNMVITVSKKIFSKYKTITEAIRSSVPGTKIIVEPGIYKESIVIDREVEIVGNGSVDEVILCSNNNSVILMQTEHASVRGITIKHIGKTFESNNFAIDLSVGSLSLENCTVSSEMGHGIGIFQLDTSPVIRECNINSKQGTGIFITNEASPIIEDCKIYNSGQNGIYVTNKGQGIIKDCEIYSNNYSNFAIDCEGDPLVKGCKIYNSEQYGIWINEKGQGTIEDCEIHNNKLANVGIDSEGDPLVKGCKIYNSEQSGVLVEEKGQGTIENCEIHDNNYPNVDIASEGNPLVKGCKIYNSEQYGVWIRENGKGIIEDCEIHSNKLANVGIDSEGDPLVKGCEIYNSEQNGIWVKEKGQGTIENCEIHDNNYPNVAIASEGNPLVKGCKIYNSDQYGVWVKENGKGIVEACEIHSNKLANVGIESEGDPLVKGCKIYNSEQSGLWVEEKGQGTIEDCEIHSNNYSNIVIESEGDPLVKGCKIYNSEQSGLWVEEKGQGTIEDCEIYSNNASNVAIVGEGDPLIKGCKIYNSEQCGLWVDEKGQGTIEYCEIHSNTYPNVAITSEGNPIVKGCKIYNSEQDGICVQEKGQGTIEYCQIHTNNYSNIVIASEGDPFIRSCKIHNSKEYGLLVEEKGRGTIENCEIFSNAKRDVLISEDSNPKIIDFLIRQDENQVTKKIEQVDSLQISSEKIDQADDLQVSEELKDVLEELNSLIGMENIKNEIQKTIEYILFNKELSGLGIESENIEMVASHTVLYGNPGTGKTTIAKLLGKLYKAMGLLPSGHVVQVNREKLVGEYIGQTAPKTKSKIDEAQGGILFIDEAYSLTNKGSENDFGPEAIEVLLEEMENRKGKFVLIVAGYEKEMDYFLEANPGLKSRFTQYFHLQDYTPDEMLEIARKMIKDKKRLLSKDAEEMLYKQFTVLWRKRDRFFSNARTVRNYIEGMLPVQAQRCMRVSREKWNEDFLRTITAEDVQAILPKEQVKTFDLPINEEQLSEVLQQLNRMVGMDKVKEEIEKLVTLVRFYKEERRDLSFLSTHTVLTGRPGTGKTEVARIIAKIYQALGILECGDLIEVNRDKLVSAYPGESEKLIAHYIDKAMGGTLFIDEAYQLTQYGAQDPGHKVIEVLLKRMEDDRGKFIVIVAGYKEEMDQFLNSNDGLRRRFGRQMEFEDYKPAELMQISELILQEKGYVLSVEAYEFLFTHYECMYVNRNNTFGNAGFARNTVHEAIKNLDYRIARISKEERNQEIMRTIMLEDIAFLREMQGIN